MKRNGSPEEMLAEAGVVQLAPAPRGAKGAARSRPRFTLTRFVDVRVPIDEDYCVKGFLPRSGLAIVWGPPKCGKSFWAFDLLMHVALGWSYRDRRVRQGSVVYVCLEGAHGFRKRAEAFRLANPGSIGDAPFFVTTAPLSLAADRRVLIDDIRRQVGTDTPAVVCIDTLNRSLAGSESKDEDMTAYIQAADTIRDTLNCLVLIIHHSGHNGERPRGHSSLMGALDVQVAVGRDASGNVVATLELAKDGETGLTFVSRLERIELGRDSEGDPIDSCVVKAIDAAASKPAPKRKKLSRGATIALRALHEAVDDYGETSTASTHIPANTRIVSLDRWRETALAMGLCTSDDGRAKRLAFQRATETLVAEKEASIWQQRAWPTR
jgi:AAA domain